MVARRFAFLDVGEAIEAESAPFLPGSGFCFKLLPAGRPDVAKVHSMLFKGYKMLCDVLLPELRTRSHLYNLIYRHRSNGSLVICEDGIVLGGTTFRLIHGKPQQGIAGHSLILEVLLLAVDQRAGVCGRGHGTRLVNVLKALAIQRAKEMNATAYLLTQADLGLQARTFWARQQLRESPDAMQAVQQLHDWHVSNIIYEYTVPMMMQADEPCSHPQTTHVLIPKLPRYRRAAYVPPVDP